MSGYAIINYMDLWDGEHICAQLRDVRIMCIDFFFGNIHDCTPLNCRIQVLLEGVS
jgi:hypothetical protein